MKLAYVPAFLLCAASLAGCDNPDQSANGLFVEASQAAAQAVAESDIVKKHDLLINADKAASRITTDYPGTNAAVRIASNEKLGPYTLPEIKDALRTIEASPELCLRAISTTCMASVVKGAIAYLSTLDRNSKPDPERIVLAISGWPFLAAVDPTAASSTMSAAPDRNAFINELTEAGFGFNGSTIRLITLVYEANGQDAAVRFANALSGTPAFKSQLEKNIPKIAREFMDAPSPEGIEAARAVIRAISDPLPQEVATDVDKTLCSFGYSDKQRMAVTATCSPDQMLLANTSFHSLNGEAYEPLYAAAKTPEQKTNVARAAYDLAKGGIVQHLTWYEAAGYTNDVRQLVSMYIEATESGNPARPTLIRLLESAKEPNPEDPLTRINISERTLALMHAQGSLAEQLPAIYQNLTANAAYTFPLERVINTLFSLQPITPGMDLTRFADVIGGIVHTWPEKYSANRGIFIHRIHALAGNAVKDPKPIYDAFYKNVPYHQRLGAKELRIFKANGHQDIYDAAVKASKPINEMNSVLFYLLQEDVMDAVNAGDIATTTALLDKQDRMVRYFLVRNVLSTGHLGIGKPIPDAVRAALLDKYTYDAVANELGWREDLKVPYETKKSIIFEHFKDLSDFKVNPEGWLLKSFGRFTPEDRLRALRLLREANKEAWPLYATAIVTAQSTTQR